MEQQWMSMDNKHVCCDKNNMWMPGAQKKDNTYPWKCADGCQPMHMHMMDMNKHIDMHKKMMPVQSMGSPLYAMIYQVTLVSLNKHMTGQMPKAISVDEFNVIVNDSMCELTKKEKDFKEMIKSRCTEYEDSRVFCPYCNGMLKSVVEVALITSLINGGCMFCF